jgi:hypothetical protein
VEARTGETIIAILNGDPYFVRTPNRGVRQGRTVHVGWEEATKVTFFKDGP